MTLSQTPEGLRIDYTRREFNELRQDFLELADIQLPAWTDRNNYDPGMVLANYMARLGAILNFYVDMRAGENYVKTARQLASIRRMGELDGYTPSPPSTATVPITIVTNAAGVIPKLFSVSSTPSNTESVVQYELLEETVIPAAGTYVLTFSHGFTRENIPIGKSDGSPFQEILIKDRNIATSTSGEADVAVEVYNGLEWESWQKVPKIYTYGADDKVFSVYYDEFFNAVVKFGDGITGKIPTSSSSLNIRATYRIGGGSSGSRPGRGTITNIYNARGCAIVTSVINLTAPTGGRDAETLEEAKLNLVKARTARDNLVRFDEMETAIRQAGIGVSRVRVNTAYNPYNLNVIISAGGTNPTPNGYWDDASKTGYGQIGAVGSFLNTRIADSYHISVNPAISVPIISQVFIKCQPWVYKRDVEKRARSAISSFLNADNQDFNGTVKLNEFAQVLEEINGVDYSEIIEFHRLPRAKFKAGNDVVTFGSYTVGTAVQDETWSIIFINNTNYKVVGTKSGEQKRIGVADGTQYTTTNGHLAFTASILGDVLPRAGTIYTIKTSKYVGTVSAEEDEILVQGTTLLEVTGGK